MKRRVAKKRGKIIFHKQMMWLKKWRGNHACAWWKAHGKKLEYGHIESVVFFRQDGSSFELPDREAPHE